ncbi:PREDICTED: uncharacterized protein C2orf72 homolog [Chinchilla lanigera]|uniref:uncharacterized protein C2orf72 homolog n=1 Tax=Chinchilla lanigera TaxID=34839 RepID=UPI00069765A2|nr:PREDICTED: uncharacterized protein C2orf72 homolog [Chinchilla lanigera]
MSICSGMQKALTSGRCVLTRSCSPPTRSAAPGRRLPEGAWERPRVPGLLSCFAWGSWGHRKERDATSSRGSPQETSQGSEDELALTAIFPNGDCEDCGSGFRARGGPPTHPLSNRETRDEGGALT